MNTASATHSHPQPTAPLRVRVLGPDCDLVSEADLQRLFAGSAIAPARRDRLRTWCRVMAACGDRVVGIAMYQRTDGELRVPDVAIDHECGCVPSDVANTLIDALELACLAGGCRRLVIMPPGSFIAAVLRRRGYVRVDEGCSGSWIEKAFA